MNAHTHSQLNCPGSQLPGLGEGYVPGANPCEEISAGVLPGAGSTSQKWDFKGKEEGKT